MRNKLSGLCFLILTAVIASGCAMMHSTTYRNFPVLLANGTVTNGVERTTATAYTLWDANSSLARFKNQSGTSTVGSNTYAPGTYMAALNESATSTNINDLAGTIVGAAIKAAIQGAK